MQNTIQKYIYAQKVTFLLILYIFVIYLKYQICSV